MNDVIVITCPGCARPDCIVCSKVKTSRRRGLRLLLCDRCGERISPEKLDFCDPCAAEWEAERRGKATTLAVAVR